MSTNSGIVTITLTFTEEEFRRAESAIQSSWPRPKGVPPMSVEEFLRGRLGMTVRAVEKAKYVERMEQLYTMDIRPFDPNVVRDHPKFP